MILIVSDEEDIHSLTVKKRIEEQGGECRIIDISNYPLDMSISLDVKNGQCDYTIEYKSEILKDRDIKSVWWRRPNKSYLPNVLMECDGDFIVKQLRRVYEGWLTRIAAKCVNPPLEDSLAHAKPYQLEVASSVGFDVPNTIVSNSPQEILRFVEDNKNSIYKTLVGSAKSFVETRRVDKAFIEHIERVSYCPIIVQEEVKNKRDVRVTVVGRELFVVEITPKHPLAQLDWRMDDSAAVRPASIPASLIPMIYSFMERMGLTFGCVEFCVDNYGSHQFMEVNPSGQWLFVEIEADLPISECLARLLLSH